MKYDVKIEYKDDSEKVVSLVFLNVEFVKHMGMLVIENPEVPAFKAPDALFEYKAICNFDEKRIISFTAFNAELKNEKSSN